MTHRSPRFIPLHAPDPAAIAADIAAGLTEPLARVAPKFFYDTLGSRLFDAITELPEYYPTRTEAIILERNGPAIAAATRRASGDAPALIDLGAGNCAKAARLFTHLAPRRYVAIDISVDFLRQSLLCLQREWPMIEMVGVGLDFSRRLALPYGACDGPAMVFYPGSSIGNFAPTEALRFLGEARELAGGGALLVGVDLVKAKPVLEAAYDDDLGVTAAFNRNLLRHLNRLLGADFDVREWRHLAFFNETDSRIEMHLEARKPLTVRWPGGARTFRAGERIHTENSYKWTPERFKALLREAGFPRVQQWTDPSGWFGLFLADA